MSVSNNRVLSDANRVVLRYIEKTLDSVLSAFQTRPCGQPAIILRRISSLQLTPNSSSTWRVKDREMKYSFPGQNADEAKRFTVLMRVLVEIYEAIQNGIIVTKRDMFYKDPELFGTQGVVDRLVDDIAHTCQVTRKDLNVMASPKGLIAGLSMTTDTEDVQTIPDGCANGLISLLHYQPSWILVVEKEATFRSLVENQFHHRPDIGRGLLLTGKGYPDLATRCYLRLIIDHTNLHSRTFGLFDGDPDGMNIFKTYCAGSKALASEYACNVPEMKWLGLSIQDVLRTDLEERLCLALTQRDRIKARTMLDNLEFQTLFNNFASGASLRADLQIMLMLNIKAEIQCLDSQTGGTLRYVAGRLRGNM